MCCAEIDVGEERLPRELLAPIVGGIKRFLRNIEIEIRLPWPRHVIATLAQELRKCRRRFRQLRPHVMRADTRRISSRDQTGPARRANGRMRKGSSEQRAFA